MDTGEIYYSNQHLNDENNNIIDPLQAQKQFFDFIKNYRDNNNYIYRYYYYYYIFIEINYYKIIEKMIFGLKLI